MTVPSIRLSAFLLAVLLPTLLGAQGIEEEDLPEPKTLEETTGESGDEATEAGDEESASREPGELPDRPPAIQEEEPTAGPLAELESLAEQRYLDGELAESSQLYQQLAERSGDDPKRVRYLVTAAWLEYQLAKPWRSEALLTQALVIEPDAPFASENYGEDFVSLYRSARERAVAERHNRAIEAVNRGADALRAGELRPAREAFEEALELEPGSPLARFNLALVDMASGDQDAALAGLERLLAAESADSDALGEDLEARTRSTVGLLYYRRGVPDEAVRHLERAVELEPGDARAWNNLGMSYQAQGRLDEAEAAYRRATELAPNDSQMANNLGAVYIARDKWIDAVALLLDTTRKNPEAARAWLNLALAQRGMGNLEGAAASLRRAISLDPDDEEGIASRAAASLAVVEYERGDLEAARDAAVEAVTHDPGDVESWVYRGLAERSLGDLSAARESLERAVALDPARAEGHNNLGTVLVDLREWSAAEAAFERALELRPDFTQAETNLNRVRRFLAAQDEAGGGTPPVPEARPAPPRRPRAFGARFADVDYATVGLHGALVDAVDQGSPAAEAGLRAGDLVLQADGQRVEDPSELLEYLSGLDAGAVVVLDILRDGRPLTSDIALDE